MSNKKETIEQIVDLLRSLVDDEPEAEKVKPVKKKTTKKKTTKKKTISRTKKATTTDSKNKFLSMKEMHMFKEDTAIDKKLSVMDPCPRTRSYSTIEVHCRVCGKKEKLNPALVSETQRYKCNECARSGG